MKICLAEAIKMVKEYEEKKNNLIYAEDNRSLIVYKEGEVKPACKYDYDETRSAVWKCNDAIRKIKYLVAQANITAVVDGFDISIAEALVLLAQLSCEYNQLEDLSTHQQLTRSISSTGIVEYNEYMFDIDRVEADSIALKKKISRLQVAIDRANLNTYIDVDLDYE